MLLPIPHRFLFCCQFVKAIIIVKVVFNSRYMTQINRLRNSAMDGAAQAIYGDGENSSRCIDAVRTSEIEQVEER